MSDTSEQKEILGYAVALLLLKQEAIGHELQLVQSVRPEENEDEASDERLSGIQAEFIHLYPNSEAKIITATMKQEQEYEEMRRDIYSASEQIGTIAACMLALMLGIAFGIAMAFCFG